MPYRIIPTILPAALLAVVVAGCGGGNDAPASLTLQPVRGKVLKEDGKPLTGGRVVFVSATTGLAPNGPIGADGSFTIGSGGQGDGAPEGEYKVRIEPDLGPGTRGDKPKPGGRLPFAARYTDEDASGLTATVKAGPNDLPPFRLSTRETRTALAVRPAVRD